VIQDGSSFALKNKLRDVFPGRFTTIEPAAVEIHATYSGFSDEVCSVQIAPDKEAERQFLPDPSTLKNRLLLADRLPASASPLRSAMAWRSCLPTHYALTLVVIARPDDSGPVSLSLEKRR
jgi:hypothetical protein